MTINSSSSNREVFSAFGSECPSGDDTPQVPEMTAHSGSALNSGLNGQVNFPQRQLQRRWPQQQQQQQANDGDGHDSDHRRDHDFRASPGTFTGDSMEYCHLGSAQGVSPGNQQEGGVRTPHNSSMGATPSPNRVPNMQMWDQNVTIGDTSVSAPPAGRCI